MEASVQQGPTAWQPLTPRGVAAFGRASFGRVLAVQLVFALLVAGTVVWFLHTGWFPIITHAISELPTEGEIRAGRLDWRGDSLKLLAEGRFLALAVDLEHEGKARSPAHVGVEFGLRDVQVLSLFGFITRAYPRDRVIAFNRTELGPWWGAWAPAILGLAAGAVIAGLMLSWAFLATLYCVPVWLVGLYANRDLTLGGSWRVAGAALMPGALLMTLAIIIYGLRALDMVHLLAAGGAHLVAGWVYLVWSPLHSPPYPAATGKGNPFAH